MQEEKVIMFIMVGGQKGMRSMSPKYYLGLNTWKMMREQIHPHTRELLFSEIYRVPSVLGSAKKHWNIQLAIQNICPLELTLYKGENTTEWYLYA